MKILECIRDTRSLNLDCTTWDLVSSTCLCYKLGGHLVSLYFKNIDLYQHLEINETDNVNVTDYWGNYPPMRINDCFRMPNPFFWRCETYIPNLNETSCFCFDIYDPAFDKNGTIRTNSLYKGLEGEDFTKVHEQTVSSVDQNNHMEQKKILDKQNYLERHKELLIISSFMLLMIFMICVFAISRKYKWRKRKNELELIGLLSGQVVERKKF